MLLHVLRLPRETSVLLLHLVQLALQLVRVPLQLFVFGEDVLHLGAEDLDFVGELLDLRLGVVEFGFEVAVVVPELLVLGVGFVVQFLLIRAETVP